MGDECNMGINLLQAINARLITLFNFKIEVLRVSNFRLSLVVSSAE